MNCMELTHEIVCRLIRYNEKTGRLFWNERKPEDFVENNKRSKDWICNNWNAKFAHREAFTTNSNGYREGYILGRKYKAHILIWFIKTGAWPTEQIDHKDGMRDNNIFENLVEVDNKNNSKNKGRNVNNKSGFGGVHFDKRTKRWGATIMVDGRTINLGRYIQIKDAIIARKKANIKYGFSERHGE